MAEDRYTRITLRIPKETHKALQEAADARSHSMNAEIVQRLEDSLMPQELGEIISFFSNGHGDEKYLEAQLGDSYRQLVRAIEEYDHVKEDSVTDIERALALYEVKRFKRSFMRYLKMAMRKNISIPHEMTALAKNLP